MPESLKNEFYSLKVKSKTPVWMYTGLGIVAVFIIIVMVFKNEKDDANAELILTPQSRDVYEIKTKTNNYTLYKVTRVHGDSVFVRINNYQTNYESGLREIKAGAIALMQKKSYYYLKRNLKKC